jgi:hypothetical protein
MTGLVTAAVLATLVAFLISTTEAAFSRMSRARAHELLDEGRPGAKSLVKVVGDTAAYLSVLSFLRVIAESTVAVMVTLAVVDRVEGARGPRSTEARESETRGGPRGAAPPAGARAGPQPGPAPGVAGPPRAPAPPHGTPPPRRCRRIVGP